MSDGEASEKRSDQQPVEVKPHHVVLAGGGIVALGAAMSAMYTYRSGTKSLAEDGIDPSTRMRVIPMAARALAVSTVLTGVLGAAGFYALRAHGFFSADSAELLPAKEVARFMRSPLAYTRALMAEEGGKPRGSAAGSASPLDLRKLP